MTSPDGKHKGCTLDAKSFTNCGGCGDNPNSNVRYPSQGWRFTQPKKTRRAWDFSQETQLQVRVTATRPQPPLESGTPVTSPWLLFSTPAPNPALQTSGRHLT